MSEPATGHQPPGDPSGTLPSEPELVDRYWGKLRLFAFRQLSDSAAAEDVAQETLRRTIDALRAGRVENPAALPGFVFQTARHICQQHHRSRGREARAFARLSDPYQSEGAEPLARLMGEERCTQVRAALLLLADADRQLLQWLYFEYQDPVDVARQLGVTPGALRVRRHRALGRLAEMLGPQTPPKRSDLSGNS